MAAPQLDSIPDGDERFLHDNPADVASILRDVAKAGTTVTVYFDEGRNFLLSSILNVDLDRGRVILDYGGSEATNRKALEKDRFVIVTFKEKVRVQFTVEKMIKTEYQGGPAFRIPLPKSLAWLQRREFYRVPVPAGRKLMLDFLARGQKRQALVIDVSCGGLGLRLEEADARALELGDRLAASMEMTGLGTLDVEVEVRHLEANELSSGGSAYKAGVLFGPMPGDSAKRLQRFVNLLDRELRSRTL